MATVTPIPTRLMAETHAERWNTRQLARAMRWLESDEPETPALRAWLNEAADRGLVEGDSRSGYRLGDCGRQWLTDRGL